MSTTRKGMSLHLGLNSVDADHYHGWDGALQGCENDARDMATITKHAGFDGTTILTEDATAAAATAAIGDAAKALRAGDLFLLTYSGHGGQVPDQNSDEPDRLDETWVLYDRQLVDDELYALWASFEPGVRIFVLSDSCHSGSAVREVIAAVRPEVLEGTMTVPPATGMRAMPRAVAQEVYEEHKAQYDAIQKQVPAGDAAEVGAHVLLISGCQDNQTSADGARNGLFTQTLLEVWAEGKYKGGHRKFWREIVERMPPWQSPNWFNVGPASPAFQRRRPFTI
jgi:metacaspase-1